MFWAGGFCTYSSDHGWRGIIHFFCCRFPNAASRIRSCKCCEFPCALFCAVLAGVVRLFLHISGRNLDFVLPLDEIYISSCDRTKFSCAAALHTDRARVPVAVFQFSLIARATRQQQIELRRVIERWRQRVCVETEGPLTTGSSPTTSRVRRGLVKWSCSGDETKFRFRRPKIYRFHRANVYFVYPIDKN